MAQDIHITLPSNASTQLYPENKPQLYKTELLRPLTLKGAWEVAIIDIQYPYRWKTIEEPTKFECRFREEDQTAPSRTELTFPPGYYADMPAILDKFSRICNNYFKDNKVQVVIGAEFDRVADRVVFSKQGGTTVNYFIPKGELAIILGMQPPKERSQEKYEIYFNGQIYTTRNPTNLERKSSIFIYSDIVEHQMVGDAMVQLLAVAPVKGDPNEQFYWAFNPLMYQPVCKNFVKDIEIQLCTSEGNLLPIIKGNTIVRLHFRKAAGI